VGQVVRAGESGGVVVNRRVELTPVRIQAWWSGSELGNPTIMRDGDWVM
jgi:hypothetical protein